MNKIPTSMMVIVFATTAARAQQTPVTSPPAAPTPVTVTVRAQPRQKLLGFGTSLGNWGGEYAKMPAVEREKMAALLWRDLGMNTLRLWMNTADYRPAPGKSDLARFRRNYVDSGIVRDARKMGVKWLLLAPDGLPKGMIAQENGRSIFKPGKEREYALLLADFIADLKRETGVGIDVTGIQNEPNDNERFSPDQIVTVTRLLRRELDRRGLRSTRIIAPEDANADASLYETVDRFKKDGAAWRALAGIASHSYNMAATPDIAARIAGTDKEYWMTEASDNGAEEPGDEIRAASLASRFLNDMNHRVTHWIHFIGFEVPDSNDNATRIIKYTPDPPVVTKFLKFDYYKRLRETFSYGATFRQTVSALDGDMTWTYGHKPRITVAAAKNPDGTWGIGISDYTSDRFLTGDDWYRTQNGSQAERFLVTVRVQELDRGGPRRFVVRRASATPSAIPEETVTMIDGAVTVPIAPLELVTLRSVK